MAPKSIMQSSPERSDRKKSVRFSIVDELETSNNYTSLESPRLDINNKAVDTPVVQEVSIGLIESDSKGIVEHTSTALESRKPFSEPDNKGTLTSNQSQLQPQLPAYMMSHTLSNNDLNFNDGDAVYQMGLDSDNYDLLLMPLANYAAHQQRIDDLSSRMNTTTRVGK